MTTIQNIKVGTKLIDGGVAYKVIKITTEKIEDRDEKILYYKPFFANSNNSSLQCSIPEKNLSVANIRTPLSKEKIDELFSILEAKIKLKTEMETDEALGILALNDTFELAQVLKKYSKEKNKKGPDFPKTKNDLLTRALDMIAEEVALVTNTSLEVAKLNITSALNL